MSLFISEIERMLNTLGKSLKNFPTIPMPSGTYLDKCTNRLILEERSYAICQMQDEHKGMVSKLNVEQKHVYDAVIQSVYEDKGGLFFVYGSGGCGKTFLWRTIIARLRSESLIVLPVASSGIAATLLPGGRTAHSRFKIPLKLDETSTCSIPSNSDIGELLKQTKLIIWDEAPMQHRYAFEALDRTLRDIMKSVSTDKFHKPFGGITVLMGGDFRQILPVIYKGLRSDIVSACISRSPLWSMCQLFKLVHNMRLNKGNSDSERRRIQEFSQWILNLGDGKVTSATNDSDCSINVPSEFCIESEAADINELIDAVFPDLVSSYSNVDYLRERSILTPRNKVVDHVNNLMLGKIPGEEFTYLSIDSVKCCAGEDEQLTASFPVEYLNSIKVSGIPPHNLILKVGVVVMLLRNMNQAMGLCNGTRMIVRRCLKHTVVCEIISGSNAGTLHLIPRIEMCPTDTNLPFQLVRVQYPLQVCFAMTINKAQGQSLERVGLYLPEPVFCHGQYYVAVSRVTSPDGLVMFIEKPEGGTTTVTDNVVYEEIFYNVEDV